MHWDDQKYRGDAYGAYAWAVYVAEVSVDMRTAEVRVEDFVAVQEVGKVINPVLAAGQIEGGVAQGIGFALYENVVWQEGRMVNGQMTNYIMPTSVDLPAIRVYFEEIPYGRGPAGAKGIGELPLDGTAPAIANAIAFATGVDVRRIPSLRKRCWGCWRLSVPESAVENSLSCVVNGAACDAAKCIRWRGCWMCCVKTRSLRGRKKVAAKASAALARLKWMARW